MAWSNLRQGVLELFDEAMGNHNPLEELQAVWSRNTPRHKDYRLLSGLQYRAHLDSCLAYQQRHRKRLSALEAKRRATRPRKHRIGEGTTKVSYHR